MDSTNENSYEYYFNTINQRFTEAFTAVYKSRRKSNKLKISPYLSDIYRRWYFSTMYNGTYLSPATIFESLNREYGKTPDLAPTVLMTDPVKDTEMVFSCREYNRDNHPIVEDFRALVNFCSPDIELNIDDLMSMEVAIIAAEHLHMKDPNYAMYLFDLAMDMGFVVKIPSIHANRAQLAKDAEKRLDMPASSMFDMLVSATMHYCVRRLNEFMPLDVPNVSEEYMMSLLKEPRETEQIFQQLYDAEGMDLEDIFDSELFDGFDMMEIAVISGAYLMGALLDKYFFTPFGYYLRMIRPVYVTPLLLNGEIGMFLEIYDDEDERRVAFYALCSCYYLTDFGLEYLNIKPTSTNYLDIKKRLPFKSMSGLFDDPPAEDVDMEALEMAFEREDYKVFSLKMKNMEDTSMWLNINASDITSLHRIFLEVSFFIDVPRDIEYTFYLDKSENPFTAYTSPNQTRRTKKASEVTLGDLALKKGHVMILDLRSPLFNEWGRVKWSITVTAVNQGMVGNVYPMVTALSGDLQEYLDIF